MNPTRTGGRTRYARLVILSQARSGSTMLVSSLSSHSSCVCYSEIFHVRKPMCYARSLPNDSRLFKIYRNAYPQRFLDRFIFGGYDESVAAVGFKMFPEQLRDPVFASVVRQVIADEDVHLIHLKRRNRLAQYLSLVRAVRTGVWSRPTRKPDDQSPVPLDPSRCQTAFERTEAEDRWIGELTRDRAVLQVCYEDLASDRRAWLDRIQAHVGLRIEPIEPTLNVQRQLPLSRSVSNYQALEAHFAGTPWARFFDPDLDATP